MRNQYKVLAERYEQVLEMLLPDDRYNIQPDALNGKNKLPNGDTHWYQNRVLHRLDGPAVVRDNGTKLWYVNNKVHRLDGPAVEHFNGKKEWWINGKEYSSEEEWLTQVNILKGLEVLSRIRSKQ